MISAATDVTLDKHKTHHKKSQRKDTDDSFIFGDNTCVFSALTRQIELRNNSTLNWRGASRSNTTP